MRDSDSNINDSDSVPSESYFGPYFSFTRTLIFILFAFSHFLFSLAEPPEGHDEIFFFKLLLHPLAILLYSLKIRVRFRVRVKANDPWGLHRDPDVLDLLG